MNDERASKKPLLQSKMYEFIPIKEKSHELDYVNP